MNREQFDAIVEIGVRNDWTFDEAANFYMIYGDGKADAAALERATWNAEVDQRKAAKRAAKRKN
jgi:hypothetical protein